MLSFIDTLFSDTDAEAKCTNICAYNFYRILFAKGFRDHVITFEIPCNGTLHNATPQIF
jgi:hypothetical protein